MKKQIPAFAMLSLALIGAILAWSPLQAANIVIKMTVDNSFALYYGTATAATNHVITDSGADVWQSVETFNFNLPDNNYIYVVTQSDVAVAQGFLGQFENTDTGYKFYSQDEQWQVMATGLGNTTAPYTGGLPDLALLSGEIVDANNGGNASLGWVNTVAGQANVAGTTPWGGITFTSSIDSAARWVWHDSGKDTDLTSPGDPTRPGFNHDEWLVFRIQVGAVPEPSSVGLVGVAACLVALRRRRA